MLVLVYTCQNVLLLEIKWRGSLIQIETSSLRTSIYTTMACFRDMVIYKLKTGLDYRRRIIFHNAILSLCLIQIKSPVNQSNCHFSHYLFPDWLNKFSHLYRYR